MRNFKTRKLVFAALMSAVTLVCTAAVAVPLPGTGFANVGDAVVILCGGILGSWWGAGAAALGACLADVALGYGIYAPVTFILKGIMALVVWLVAGKGTKKSVIKTAAAVVSAELIMVLGYFIYESFLYGIAVAVLNIPGNGVQGLVSAVIGFVILALLGKNTKIREYLDK